MNMNNNEQETQEFWYSLFQSFADTKDPIDDLYPEIESPIMVPPTPMTIDVPVAPWEVLENGGKEAGHESDLAVIVGDKNINVVGEKSAEKVMDKGKGNEIKMKEPSKEVEKSLGKRASANQARNIAEKRRRTNINAKIETIKELTRNHGKGHLVPTLDNIVESIQEMKLCAESYNLYPMGPVGVAMNVRAPYMYPYMPPYYAMPYFNYCPPWEPSRYDNQIIPYTTMGFNNNQPPTSNPE